MWAECHDQTAEAKLASYDNNPPRACSSTEDYCDSRFNDFNGHVFKNVPDGEVFMHAVAYDSQLDAAVDSGHWNVCAVDGEPCTCFGTVAFGTTKALDFHLPLPLPAPSLFLWMLSLSVVLSVSMPAFSSYRRPKERTGPGATTVNH